MVAEGVLLTGAIAGTVLLGNRWLALLRHRSRNQDAVDSVASAANMSGLFSEAFVLAAALLRVSQVGLAKQSDAGPPLTRRKILDRVNSLKVESSLERWLLEVLLAPEGSWPDGLQADLLSGWECVATLHWAMGLDQLDALFSNPKYRFTDTPRVLNVRHPNSLQVRPLSVIRPARDDAEFVYSVCYWELAARGELDSLTGDEISTALKVREHIQAIDRKRRIRIGAKTLVDSPSSSLWVVMARASVRLNTLKLIDQILSGEKSTREIRSLYGQFLRAA